MAVLITASTISLLGLLSFSGIVRYRKYGEDDLSIVALSSISAETRGDTAQWILTYLQASYSIILLVFFITCFTARSIAISSSSESSQSPDSPTIDEPLGPGGKTLPKRNRKQVRDREEEVDFSRPRKLAFQWLSLALAFTFVANAANVVVHAVLERHEGWWCGQAAVIYIVGSFMVYCLVVISIFDSVPSPTIAHLSTWILGMSMEVCLVVAALVKFTKSHHDPRMGNPIGGPIYADMSFWEAIDVSIAMVRILVLLCLVTLYAVLTYGKPKSNSQTNRIDEHAPLLTNGQATDYGLVTNKTIKQDKKEGAGEEQHAGWEKPKRIVSRSWWEYTKGYSVFFPYLWPSKDRKLQVVTVICFVVMIAQRGVQFMVPYQAGVLVDDLSGENGDVGVPWTGIALYIFYRLLQGNNGILGAIRSTLWVPVSQYSFRELSVASFEHVHGLSLDFHLSKKTGEVLSALGKGNAINSFLESVTFQVMPMLVDLCVAIAYFMIEFDAYYALVVTVVTFWYIYLTIRMAQWRGDIRREMVDADRQVDAVKNDSMVSYESVKYFNAEIREFERYRDAVNKYLNAEYHVYLSLNFMNITQNLVFTAGLMITCFIAAYQVSIGQLKVGKFVALLTYMSQLQGPLNFFGTFYRMIQSAMINAERMLELFKEKATVIDSPTAKELPLCDGGINFENVFFSYDVRKPALQGLDFYCPPGTTTALVGESGGGKSTVFRLLYRFYNANSGVIKVDDHDIAKDVTVNSLRSHIGVVPQDTVLFNETLMYNLKYANPDANDDDVYHACQAASIHDRILTFPDGYQTKVGERGLRLSGGEKQRVAIARAILKNPRIILLDEATAALDTETEEHIQEALLTLAVGRTMLIIAHRLSTITMADQILVLHDGRVVERGTHEQLLAMKGRYSTMWKKQVRAQRAAEEAKLRKDKVERVTSSKEIQNLDRKGSTSSESSHEQQDASKLNTQAAIDIVRARASSGAASLTGILSPGARAAGSSSFKSTEGGFKKSTEETGKESTT